MDQPSVKVVVFHDRGVGREIRPVNDQGEICLYADEDREMLCDSLCAPVQQAIADGITQGFTGHPSYPQWYVTTVAGQKAA